MSVRDLADTLNMTTGAIYGHFKRKANLLGEAVRAHRPRPRGARRPALHGDRARAVSRDNFRDYRRRRALRALLVQGAAAARVDADVRALLHDVMLEQQSRWAKLYRHVWVDQRLDPEGDPAGVMLFLWTAELGLGVLEALDIELPKPGVLSTIVGRMLGCLTPGRGASRGGGRPGTRRR